MRIAITGTHASVRHTIRQLPGMMAGRIYDPTGQMRAFALAVGQAMLTQVKEDFVTKAAGGTGRDGITWPYLTKHYLAYGRFASHAELKEAGASPNALIRGSHGGHGNQVGRHLGLLTAAQHKRWKKIYGGVLHRQMEAGVAERDAREIAGKIAWSVLKKEGAVTRIGTLGERMNLQILRDTGDMLESFSMGLGPDPGMVTIGLAGVKASHHRRGRPFWPLDGDFPDAWWAPVLVTADRKLVEIAELVLRAA